MNEFIAQLLFWYPIVGIALLALGAACIRERHKEAIRRNDYGGVPLIFVVLWMIVQMVFFWPYWLWKSARDQRDRSV